MTDIDDPPSTDVHICYNAKDSEENNVAQEVMSLLF